MKMCMNFDRHCGPHHFRPGMDHFGRHRPYGGPPHWNFCHRRREGPFHHGGPPGFPHAPPPYMFMGGNCHYHHRFPHPCQPDHSRFQENRPRYHHCRRNNNRPSSGRPLSCPPFGRPPFVNGPFDRPEREDREPFDHHCCHQPHRRDRINHNCEHCDCGNSSAAR